MLKIEEKGAGGGGGLRRADVCLTRSDDSVFIGQAAQLQSERVEVGDEISIKLNKHHRTLSTLSSKIFGAKIDEHKLIGLSRGRVGKSCFPSPVPLLPHPVPSHNQHGELAPGNKRLRAA